MKTKITVSLMLLWLAGCQQKSELDKCVESLAVSECSGISAYKKEELNACVKDITEIHGGAWRLECLKGKIVEK
jgi:hypothetical protein